MVKNRNFTVTYKDITKRISRGCSQGGILSGYLQGYVDDLVTLAEGNDREFIWQRTQKNNKQMQKWCDTKKLNISALKSKIFMFAWNRNWKIRPISVGGNTISLYNSMKFLDYLYGGSPVGYS